MTGPPLPRRRWYRTFPAVVGFVAVAVVIIASGIVAIALSGGQRSQDGIPPSQRAELAEWWSTAQPHVTDLQKALDDSLEALRSMDGPGLGAACQRMHDSAGVDLAAHLPAPDRDLTAELEAAAQDAHDAAHMCLAVLELTPNNYDAEFVSDIDQADRHLKAAVAIIDRSLTN
ncbi:MULTISPECIES: hypothetical protein [Mycolicibacterium]|jgi:hypothetical protein|uniref:hypothetical protein n=1 Tax=Mycolicibacterium TaxID=1866885 RepID=UPI001CA30B17|nr:hypothetical protein [Mycolicibacterium austroafricanum]QZT58186.1 hypothetical protein JN084_06170 [Mycolicibacterium austroafricanum]